jgi:hypothetical protein
VTEDDEDALYDSIAPLLKSHIASLNRSEQKSFEDLLNLASSGETFLAALLFSGGYRLKSPSFLGVPQWLLELTIIAVCLLTGILLFSKVDWADWLVGYVDRTFHPCFCSCDHFHSAFLLSKYGLDARTVWLVRAFGTSLALRSRSVFLHQEL